MEVKSLELNKDFFYKIVDYMSAKGYSSNTIKSYSIYLRKISKQYKVLDDDSLRKILKKIKHQNQRAVLVLINDYCYFYKINFRVVLPKMKAKARKLPVILTIEEIKLMIESSPKPFDLMIRVIFNLGAGLRISEGIKLCWNDIRWIDWLKTKDYGIAHIKDSKGGKGRVVNIPKKLMVDLYEYAKELDVLNEFGVPTGNMIFKCGTENFKPELMQNNIEAWKEEYLVTSYNWFRYNVLQKCCEKALNKKIHVHSLRHSRATYLYEVEKVPIERIQELLGHADIKTTLIYTHVDPKSTFEMIKNTGEV